MAPFYFTADCQTPLRSLAVEFEFASNLLKFHNLQRALPLSRCMLISKHRYRKGRVKGREAN